MICFLYITMNIQIDTHKGETDTWQKWQGVIEEKTLIMIPNQDRMYY